MVIPSREDSYERLLEAEKQFVSDAESVEEISEAELVKQLGMGRTTLQSRKCILEKLKKLL